ncbi:putative reverse transcriptase domain-containing protein [Tanacetum coccineum]
MMTARRRVGTLSTHHLDVRHSVDYSSSNRFSSDDSSRDSSSSSSLESSLDSSADALSDFASSHSSSNHSLPTPSSRMRPSHHLCSLVLTVHRSSVISERPSHDSSSASLSRKRSRSSVASVPLSSPTLGALSYARADLLPSPKRIRSPETATDLEGCSKDSFEPYVPREAGLGVDFEDESSDSSRSRGNNLKMDVDVERSDGIEIDPGVQAEIDEYFAYADALRDIGIDARVVVEAIDREEIKMGVRGLVEDRVTHPVVADDIPELAHEGAVEVIESVQRDQGHRIVAAGQQSADMLERIGELERDNMRLRDIVDVKIFKRHNVGGQNVARAYTGGNNERKGYVGSLPYCNKCKTHHVGPCTVRCGNCKRVGHMTRDCKVTVTPNTQRAPIVNQPGIVCYECGRPGYFRKDCPKLRNQNRGNKTGNKNGNKTENQTGGNEATTRAYTIGGGGTNSDSNVFTGTFLLNNCYASMLFDSGVDRSFVSSTFSALLDVAPSTLDTSYAVELADGRIS